MFTSKYLDNICYPFYKGRLKKKEVRMFVCFGCTISVHHQILAVMGPSTTGSVDGSFRWKSIFTPDPGPMDCHNSFYNSSPVKVEPRWIPKSAHAVLYSGSATVMGNTSQIEPHQRPALSTFHNHDQYYDCIQHTEDIQKIRHEQTYLCRSQQFKKVIKQ